MVASDPPAAAATSAAVVDPESAGRGNCRAPHCLVEWRHAEEDDKSSNNRFNPKKRKVRAFRRTVILLRQNVALAGI